MSNAISVRLQDDNKAFLDVMKEKGVIPSKAINHAIDLYKKYLIQKELMEEAMMEDNKDVEEAISDFKDYYSIIKSDETV